MYLIKPKCTKLPFFEFQKHHWICKTVIEIAQPMNKIQPKEHHTIQKI